MNIQGTQNLIEMDRLRLILQQELMRRISSNSRYSLRAFAKSLGIQAPTLSHILKGNRKLPKNEINRIISALNLGPETFSNISITPKQNDSSLTEYRQFTVDIFNVIAEWYHFTILELVRLPTFKPDPKWIARTLDISINEVNAAIERLVRVEMLEIDKKGMWTVLAPNNTTTTNPFTNAALKKVQKQFLQKAQTALDETAIDLREQSGMTVALNLKDIPVVKERIKKFRRDLTKFIEANNKPDEVYQISFSFFPLTKNKEIV